jgi:Recombinase
VPWSVRQRVLREYHAGNPAQARRASEEMVRAGFNTGAMPYGYRAQRVRVAPAGRRPRWRTRLVIEPVEAEDGLAITAIRQRHVAARYLAPLDPETGQLGVWTRAVIRAILRNPNYTGRQVWGRRHHGRHAASTPVWAHAPLITVEEFAAAHRRSWRTETPPGDSEAARPSQQRRAA